MTNTTTPTAKELVMRTMIAELKLMNLKLLKLSVKQKKNLLMLVRIKTTLKLFPNCHVHYLS